MSVDLKFDRKGRGDIERTLAQLPAGTAKGLVRRVLKRELKPIADMANALYPGAEDDVVRVTSKVARTQPQPEKRKDLVTMGVGAAGSRVAHLLEWGTGPRHWANGKYTGQVAPQAFLAPAWDAYRGQIMDSLARQIWAEIEKTMARRAKRGL